jgi:hypothetical protein
MSVTKSLQAFSSAAASYAYTVPTISNDGSFIIVFAVCASNTRTYSPSGGPGLTTLAPSSGSSSQSGHISYAWQGSANIADTGATITFTQTGGNLKTLFATFVVSDPHASSPMNVHPALALAAGTSHASPGSLTTAYGCVELQAVFDSRGASTPNTSTWGAPGAMSSSSGLALTGTTALCSGALGYNATVLATGSAVGGDSWAFDQSAIGSSWTIAVRTSAAGGDPVISYTRQRVVEVDARASTGGTVALTQTDGPTTGVGISEGPTGFFRVTVPEDQSEEIELTLAMTGATSQVLTILPVGFRNNRWVFDGADWVQ